MTKGLYTVKIKFGLKTLLICIDAENDEIFYETLAAFEAVIGGEFVPGSITYSTMLEIRPVPDPPKNH
jgi:hypothetical protein